MPRNFKHLENISNWIINTKNIIKPTYPKQYHRHKILFGCEQIKIWTSRGLILHIFGIPTHLRLQIHENLSCCSFKHETTHTRTRRQLCSSKPLLTLNRWCIFLNREVSLVIQNWEHPILFIEFVHHIAQPICYQNVGLRIDTWVCYWRLLR